ncbi:hypothetical protein ACLXBB_36665 [Pseudomonas aeruginosa]
MSRSNGSSSRRTFLRLAALLLPAGEAREPPPICCQVGAAWHVACCP